jgi:hypothetical protein
MPKKTIHYTKPKIPFLVDTIYLENESLNASYFKLLDANNTAINSTLYNVDFLKGTLLLKEIFCLFRFYHGRIPEISWFLTKEYRNYDPKRVVSNDIDSDKLYQINTNTKNIPLMAWILLGALPAE